MRKLLITLCAGLAACASMAGVGYQTDLYMGTNTSATVEFRQTIRGTVDTIYVACVTNGVLKANEEADVGLTYSLHHGGGSADLVATNTTVTGGAATWRPRVLGTSTAGATLAAVSGEAAVGEGTNAVPTTVLSAPYEPFVLTGEPVTLYVTSSTTGVVWKAVIVTRK